MTDNTQYRWHFYNIGGLDQVTLRTAEELRHLAELDPKLWVVLSCPVKGLQFDERTLQLLDEDKDGRIRIPDVLSAVKWLVGRLRNPETMVEDRKALPLSFIRDDIPEGRVLLASARHILRDRGKPDALVVSQEDITQAAATAAQQLLNGDGIIPVHPDLDADLQTFIQDVISVQGSVLDASHQPGVSLAIVQEFMDGLGAFQRWWLEQETYAATMQLGPATPPAYKLIEELTSKIDDYFVRSQLVGYDQRASDAVNAPESILVQLGSSSMELGEETMRHMPLARVAPQKPLPLDLGLNPAWSQRVREFRTTVITPLLGDMDSLSEPDWQKLKDIFAPYAALVAKKPNSAPEHLGIERINELLHSDLPMRFEAIINQDLAVAPEIAHMTNVERMVLYHRHLHHLLMNFVSFCDFYEKSRQTTFQIGTLYIDGRSCELCLGVDEIEPHSTRAVFSCLCLAYCTCTRRGSTETRNIVAAVTAGTPDFLVPGRHGVFVDNTGASWDATLIKLTENPISIRTAIFAPYRRFARMISSQIEKFSAAKDQQVEAGLSAGAGKLVTPPATAPAAGPAPMPFDIGRNVGILAAIGLAVGALGTALATITASVLAMPWWEIPLLVFGILALISGPSMVMAWLKLRKRTLGPVLDASAWAVNTQIPINFVMGKRLTDSATLPSNSMRSTQDPFQKSQAWKRWMTMLVIAFFVVGCALGGYWGMQKLERRARHNASQPVGEMPANSAPAAPEPVVTAPVGAGSPDNTLVSDPPAN